VSGALTRNSGICNLTLNFIAVSSHQSKALQGSMKAISADAKHLRRADAVAVADFEHALNVEVAHSLKWQRARAVSFGRIQESAWIKRPTGRFGDVTSSDVARICGLIDQREPMELCQQLEQHHDLRRGFELSDSGSVVPNGHLRPAAADGVRKTVDRFPLDSQFCPAMRVLAAIKLPVPHNHGKTSWPPVSGYE
jgi:hypothetical protein